MKERLYLIDGSALLYRSYFAFINNPLINSKGQNTSAIFGCANSFIKMSEKFKMKNVIISFDGKEKTFRHEMTDTYKANRPPMPQELVSQIAPVKEFFELIGVPEVHSVGFEADDVLASIAEKYKTDYEVILISGDKDFAQIVDETVSLYDPGKDKSVTYADVVEKYGLTPEQFIDYLAIVGDSADNIPGVKGIGPKGAQQLLSEYKNLENIYKNIDEITRRHQTKLLASKEEAFLSQKLATIIRDVEIPEKIAFEYDEKSLANAVKFAEDYELKSILKKISPVTFEDLMANTIDVSTINFEAKEVVTTKDFNTLLKEIKKVEVIAIDTETTDIDSHLADLVGISLAFDNKNAYYLPFAHLMAENLPKSAIPKLEKALKGKTIIGHNLKYDYRILERHNLILDGSFFDTMIAAYLLHPERQRHNLDLCAETEFSYEMKPISELIGKGKNQITFDLVPLDQATFYAAEDAYVTYQLYNIYSQRLEQNDLTNLFETIEMPLSFVLYKMENEGVFIDEPMLEELHNTLNIRLKELTSKIYEIAGKQFNINSTKQLGVVLFEELEIPPIKKTKTGYSTDVSVLEELAKNYEIAKLLIEYRQLTKLDSTYISALPKLINENSGRIHSSFNQTVASTGRLSSTNPNLQNIPIRSELGKQVRKAFVPQDKDWVIVAADYSQIELRLMAMMSEDENMLNAFINKEDVHRQTASLILDKAPEDITSDDRRSAKAINFGIIYGMGAKRLSGELGISVKEAKSFIESYFEKFPKIKEFMSIAVKKAQENMFVQTIAGRKLPLPNIKSSNKRLLSEAERVAVNMPIQGSAADIIKIAMINIDKKISSLNSVKMLIQVHDELVFAVQKDDVEEISELIRSEMENAMPEEWRGKVPLVVDVGVGQNWFEAH